MINTLYTEESQFVGTSDPVIVGKDFNAVSAMYFKSSKRTGIS